MDLPDLAWGLRLDLDPTLCVHLELLQQLTQLLQGGATL